MRKILRLIQYLIEKRKINGLSDSEAFLLLDLENELNVKIINLLLERNKYGLD